MRKVTVNFHEKVGAIKPVHGIGQPPFTGIDYSLFSYLKQAHIPYSRLHDVGGAYGRGVYVDIPNLFRNFDADPADPNAYDFAFTDGLITALMENGVEPVFRLGVTIENHVKVRVYRIFPPTDFLKWAKICEGVIRHYTQGWADGFHYDIRYWEIWNEPENSPIVEENPMWQGTKEQYFALYHVAATYLKEQFPHIKIGGYGSCGFYALYQQGNPFALSSSRVDYFITFLDEFLAYIKQRGTPFDFFSWHSYDGVEKNLVYARYARKKLDDAGYSHVETSCNEWHICVNERGTQLHAAQNTAGLIGFQESPVDTAMFYDAGFGTYGGLFDPVKRKPFPLYYGFRAFGELYAMGTQVQSMAEGEGLYACAATDGSQGGILIVNIGKTCDLQLQVQGGEIEQCCLMDAGTFVPCQLPDTLPENGILYIKTRL